MLGRTVQIYTTGLCKMNCPHCGSRRLRDIPNMALDTFKIMVRALKWLGVERVELFANDPLLHPQIREQVETLNESEIEYAILTVGASPHDPEVKERFFWVMKKIDKKRGSFVFSVDYTKETAEKILSQTTLKESRPYAFKAKTFWWLVPLLRAERIPVRINVVISRYNIDEVTAIIERAARIGFATSFCFVQTRRKEFDELSRQGLTPRLEKDFREYLRSSEILELREIDKIIKETREIAKNELEDKKDQNGQVRLSPFNLLRGDDPSEAEIPSSKLIQLRKELLDLKSNFREKVLPGGDFIKQIGRPGHGCIEFLKRGKIPPLKIGPKGEMIFCCDLHDPYTKKYSIGGMYEFEKRRAFIKMCRINPYIWICTYFNPCDFSVNWVRYDASAAKV